MAGDCPARGAILPEDTLKFSKLGCMPVSIFCGYSASISVSTKGEGECLSTFAVYNKTGLWNWLRPGGFGLGIAGFWRNRQIIAAKRAAVN
jgi:translation elongation factor EF-G